MSQTTQKGRSRKKGVSPMERWRKTKGFWAFLLAFSIAFTNMGSSAINAIAGSEMEREEFRLHVEDIRKAAEEAIENDEPIGEDFFQINGSDQNLVEDYEKLLDADGTLFEIFPEIETVKGTGSIELRVFLRIAEDGDPASYALTGEEELVFLYVNGNDEPAAARLNIDGYQTGFATVRPFETALETGTPQVITGGGSGSSSGTGSDVSEPMYSGENESNEAEENVTESAAEMNGSEAMDSLAAEESAAEGKNEEENAEPPAETAADDSAPVEESEPGENQQEQGEVILPEETLPASTEGMEETEEIAEPETEAEPEIQLEEDDAAEEGAEASEEESAVQGEDEIDSNQEEASVQEEQKEDEGEEVENIQLSRSRNQVASVMVSLASSSQAEKDKDSDEEADEEEYAEDDKDKDELSPEDEIFEKKGYLDGKLYNAVSLNETVTARAYVISLEEIGANAKELMEGAHLITYSFVPVGTAELIQAPELVRDEALVTFGIRPQVGYSIIQATANGQELEQAEGSVVASRSEALRARIASPSDALSTEDQDDEIEENDIIYYTIPSVLEDQEVQIVMVESANGSHPAFHQEKTVNGVTVTVEAKEGILPAGTELTVEEVTEQVEPAIRAKMGGEVEAAIFLDDEESSEENADDQADEETGEETEEASNITAVLAYDINLMLNGKKLNNTWGDSNYVTVRFSGDRIQEASKEADKIEIAALKTPTETVEAALGGTEEMPVVDHLTADNIELDTEGRQAIGISEDEGVREIEAEVSHFSIYTLVWSGKDNVTLRVNIVDEDGQGIGSNDNNVVVNFTRGSSMQIHQVADDIIEDKISFFRNYNYYFHKAYIFVNGELKNLEAIRLTSSNQFEGIVRSANMATEYVNLQHRDVYFAFTQHDYVIFDANGGQFSDGSTEKLVHITGGPANPHIDQEDIPRGSNAPTYEEAVFNGWVYMDNNKSNKLSEDSEEIGFSQNTYIRGGTRVYALYKAEGEKDSVSPSESGSGTVGELQPGDVEATKTASWVDYENGIARIDLTVKGEPENQGVDVMLVLDKSGSMSYRLTGQQYPERMGQAKEAAQRIVDLFLTESENNNNRVAYVPFSSNNRDPVNHTESSVGFRSKEDENTNGDLARAIAITDAFGGTSYYDALTMAKNIFKADQYGDGRDKYMIFISDGVPNEPNSEDTDRIVPLAQDLKENYGVHIYSVGIEMSEEDASYLRQISSDNRYYDVENIDQISDVLMKIAEQIQYAGTNARFTDVLSKQFTALSDDEMEELGYQNSDGVSHTGNIYTVNVGTITREEKQYTFYVRVADDFKNSTWADFTNKRITLSYVDIDGDSASIVDTDQDTGDDIEIGVPKLDHYYYSLNVKKVLDGVSSFPSNSKVAFNLYRGNETGGFTEADQYYIGSYSPNSDGIIEIGLGFLNDGESTLTNGEAVWLNDGETTYYLKETATEDGYELLPEPIKIELKLNQKGNYADGSNDDYGHYGMIGGVDSNLVDNLIVNSSMNNSDKYLDKGKDFLTVYNFSGVKLPETGGPGLGLIKEFGWMLLLLAAMMAGVEVQMNRRRRNGR